jgi:hypothetical protein
MAIGFATGLTLGLLWSRTLLTWLRVPSLKVLGEETTVGRAALAFAEGANLLLGTAFSSATWSQGLLFWASLGSVNDGPDADDAR